MSMYEIAKEQISDTDVKDAFQQFKTSAVSQHPDFKHDLQLVEGGSTGVASKYIGFLREIGRKGKPHHILAAILPAMRTYRYLGWFLNQYATSKHPFFKWISTYWSYEFDMSVKNMEHIVDKLVVRPGKKQVKNLFRISFRAKRLVAEIFHALMKPTIVPLMHNHPDMVLFVGFDINAAEDIDHPVEESDGFINEDTGWCSGLFETTSALTRKSVRKRETAEEKKENDEYEHTVDVLRTVSQFLNQKYEACIKAITPVVSVGYSFSNLSEEFKKLTECEKEANEELMKSSLLKGLKEKHIKQFGERFSFHRLCWDVLSKFGNRATVISSSWCGGNVVREVINKGVLKEHFKMAFLEQVAVHGNELCFEQSSCTGDFQIKVHSAMDKVRIFLDNVERECGLTIYVGESLNDLLAMMKADIGIIINPNSRLLTVAPQFGIECVPLYLGLLNKLKLAKTSEQEEGGQSIWREDSGVLYTVNKWEQLYIFLFGVPEEPKKWKFWEKESTTDDDDDCWSSGIFKDYKDPLANTSEDPSASLEDEDDIFAEDDHEDYLTDDEIPFVNDPDSDFEDEDSS
uniref:uncharacterized protein LOC101303867 n=1 Tax=Fragaria vesca subsp. vesca TaxID=101020 RepID=UPI0005C9491D|nr:PREDICTED: uncharacterized protein LOC101303867 [Fragaria vesca subsp. vesca]